MVKYLTLLLIIGGLMFIGLGSYDFYKSSKAQTKSLAKAYEVLKEPLKEVSSKIPHSFLPKQGETVGLLEIPKIDRTLPIIEGTDEKELNKGVGHLQGTGYPTQDSQIVLSGHRDTVFKRMGELDIGDTLTIHLPYGTFTYKIAHTRIVNADDQTVVKSTFPNEELIVSTCYPFSFIGDAPERYIITAYPLKNGENNF